MHVKDLKMLADLSNARLRLLMECSLAAIHKGSHLHYTQANKCGKYLAQVIHHRQNIPHIITSSNQKLHKNSEIVSEFKEFYTSLYNLPLPSEAGARLNSDQLGMSQYI